MRLKNFTSIDTEFLRAVIRAVCPSNVSSFTLHLKNYGKRGCRGRAYASGCARGGHAEPLVVVSIAPTEARARYVWGARGAYLPANVGSRREALVFIVAHELRHLWQKKVPRGYRVWGSRGQFSERDADAYALRMLRAFRRGQLAVPS